MFSIHHVDTQFNDMIQDKIEYNNKLNAMDQYYQVLLRYFVLRKVHISTSN